MAKRLYIIYNADGTISGKLRYGYRKLMAKKDSRSPCAACDITNGGLSLSESPGWLKVKRVIVDQMNLQLKQLHRDEIAGSVRNYTQENAIRLPVVLLEETDGDQVSLALRVLLDSSQLAECAGDPERFLSSLQQSFERTSAAEKVHASL